VIYFIDMHKVLCIKFWQTPAYRDIQTGITQGWGNGSRISVLAAVLWWNSPFDFFQPIALPVSRARSYACAAFYSSFFLKQYDASEERLGAACTWHARLRAISFPSGVNFPRELHQESHDPMILEFRSRLM